MRLWLPESPRWLMTHGRAAEAERVVAGIEQRVAHGQCRRGRAAAVRLAPRAHAAVEVMHTLVHRHRPRAWSASR
jgi:hypothetical protein